MSICAATAADVLAAASSVARSPLSNFACDPTMGIHTERAHALQVEPFRPQMAHPLCRIAPSPITMLGSWEERLLQMALTHIRRTVSSGVRMVPKITEYLLSVKLAAWHGQQALHKQPCICSPVLQKCTACQLAPLSEALQQAIPSCGDFVA